MDCSFMLETKEPSIFTNYNNGKLYAEITLNMIQGCLNDELDEMYEGWSSASSSHLNYENTALEASGSEIIRACFPDRYQEYIRQYCERNQIIQICKDGIHRYFEPKEN